MDRQAIKRLPTDGEVDRQVIETDGHDLHPTSPGGQEARRPGRLCTSGVTEDHVQGGGGAQHRLQPRPPTGPGGDVSDLPDLQAAAVSTGQSAPQHQTILK